MKSGLRCAAFTTALLALIGLITSCPLPYDFSGEGAGRSGSSDPSSPHITAPVTIAYSEEGGASGTLENDVEHFAGVTTTLTLTTTTENAVIYYTDDGSELTSFGSAKKINASSGSITIVRTTGVETRQIQAVAVGSGMLPSPPVQGKITVTPFPVLTVLVDHDTIPEEGGSTSFAVAASRAPETDLTINLTTGGTYEVGDIVDLGEVPGGAGSTLTVTMEAETTSVQIPVTSLENPEEFDDQIVTLSLEPGDGYVVGSASSASVTIIDSLVPVLTITQSATTISDDGGVNDFTVAIQGGNPLPFDLEVTLRATGTYEVGDLVGLPAPGTNMSLTIPEGQSSITHTVTGQPDPGEFDDESVTVSLVSDAAYSVGTPGSVMFIILDTSPVAMLNLNVSATNTVDTASVTFTVNASVAPDADLLVTLSPTGFDASRVDALYYSVSIPAGATSTTFDLMPIPEVGFERMTGMYTLVSGTGYTVGTPNSRSVTIIDDVYGSFEYVGYWTGAQTTSPVGTGASMTFVGEAGTIGDRIYVNGDADRGDDARVNVSGGLDKNSFTVAVMFRMASFRNPGGTGLDRPIIIGGPSYRWMQLVTDGEGDLGLRFNNGGQVFDLTGLVPTLMINNTYLAVINVDVPALTATVHFGGGVPMPSTTVALPGGFVWAVEVEHNTTFDEIIQARSGTMPFASFDGEYDFYFVANGILRPDEVMDLISTDPDL